jgi:hypothetical protein
LTRRAAPVNDPAAEILELLRSYPRCRFQSLILQKINTLYLSLRGHLSDQIREIGFCRQRLVELSDLLASGFGAARFPGGASLPQADQLLFANNCSSLEEAAHCLENTLSAADILAFDHKIQELLRPQFRALVNVCMASSSHIVQMLTVAMHQEGLTFLETRLQGENVVDLYLNFISKTSETSQGTVQHYLATVLERAAPSLLPIGEDRNLTLAAVPSAPASNDFRNLLKQWFPEVRIITWSNPDEILFYREHFQVFLAALPQLSKQAMEIYRQRLLADPLAVHSRNDITEWLDPA